MKPLVLVNAVGLSMRQVGADTPHLAALRDAGCGAPMTTILPAVTCSAQATMLTGTLPSEHGIVGNGWYFPDMGEVFLWRQANGAIRGEKLYERARRRDPSFTCAKLFWWWNMGAAVDWSITPRPFYPADGRKILAVYGKPDAYREQIESELGPFPFFDFWGPKSGYGSSRWITDSALKTIERQRPTLTLVYLPHLDYDHQRYGPDDPRSLKALRELDGLIGELRAAADGIGAELAVVSEYAIEDVSRPVHVNRALREAGLLEVRETPTGEMLDFFASRAFCVSDHQVAHVYARDEASRIEAARVLSELDGVDEILDAAGQKAAGIGHERSGDLVAIAEPDAWFTYYYWLDDRNAPDFAPTIDIHRKPGYDPCELFFDPKLKIPALRVARRLARKALGFRYLLDVVPLDATLVRGSHGRLPSKPERGAIFLSSSDWSKSGGEPQSGVVEMTSVPERALALMELGN